MARLTVNGREHELDAPDDMPLLWALRDVLGLHGTRYSCGKGLCGACTVHVDGVAMRACITPLSICTDKAITTIEGLGQGGLHPLQQAWIEQGVPQCGFCQSGQLMTAAALLATNARPTDADIDAAMAGNICRCGTYTRIRAGIKAAAATLPAPPPPPAPEAHTPEAPAPEEGQ